MTSEKENGLRDDGAQINEICGEWQDCGREKVE
jgi:hypothetical protein